MATRKRNPREGVGCRVDTVIVKGSEMASVIKAKLKEEVNDLFPKPQLAILLVGDDEESRRYVRLKEKAVDEIGGQCRAINLPENTTLVELLGQIRELNADPHTHGILVQLPLPGPLATEQETVLSSLSVVKDVDGFHPFNRGKLFSAPPFLVSCAALACMDIITMYRNPRGLLTVLVGDSFDLVQPLALLLMARGSRVCIIPEAHEWEEVAAKADVLVVEKGRPLMVKADHLKPGALVIDAGFHWEAGRVCGNVDPMSVTGKAGWLVPVPGGIGPLLIAKLLENLLTAYREQVFAADDW